MADVTQTPTLMHREETQGRIYPLWIERLMLLLAVVVFAVFAGDVRGMVEHPLVGPLAAYLVFPLTLLAVVELFGRLVQSVHASKL